MLQPERTTSLQPGTAISDFNYRLDLGEKSLNITGWTEVSGHWECKILLDSPRSLDMINPTEIALRSPSTVVPLLFFQDYRFYSWSSRPIESMLFKINNLRNAIFVSLYF
jgi:hypothetical protein